jgi:hypothetical protein
MFIVKSKNWIALALVSQIAVESAAAQCDMILEDKHNYEVLSGSALGMLGAFVPGGALVTGAAVVASALTDQSNTGNKSEREIELRDFLRKTKPRPEISELNKMGFYMISENKANKDCQISFIIQKSRVVGGDYGRNYIQQTFEIIRTQIDRNMDKKIISIDSEVKVVFQPKPPKRLKEDSRTGKYIEITSPMMDSDIYYQKIVKEYNRVTIIHLSRVLKKLKIKAE